MKDMILLCSTLVFMLSGFWLMRKVDAFISTGQQVIAAENRKDRYQFWIAAETPSLFASATAALEYCSVSYPYMEFFVSSGNAGILMQKLRDGTIDIVLLTEAAAQEWEQECSHFRIPCQTGSVAVGQYGLSVDALEKEKWVYVVWNDKRESRNRDRVIAAFENETCIRQCGCCVSPDWTFPSLR